MSFGRHGPSDAFFWLDGYDVLLNDVQSLEYTKNSETAEVTGLGDAYREHSPTGVSDVEVEMGGALFNDADNYGHEALNSLATGPQTADRIMCLGAAETSAGANCVGFEGAIIGSYKVVMSFEDLQRINATFQMDGAADEGVVLYLGSVTTDDQSTQVDDLAACSSGGGVGYFHCRGMTTSTGLLAAVYHSSDGASWASLAAFTSVVSSEPVAYRVETTADVGRYLALNWDLTGTGDAEIFGMFSRATCTTG